MTRKSFKRLKDVKLNRALERGEISPADVCRAALKAVGVPREKVDRMPVGRYMDAWVEYAVTRNMPVSECESAILKRWPEFALFATNDNA
jgi:hypothetical protein